MMLSDKFPACMLIFCLFLAQHSARAEEVPPLSKTEIRRIQASIFKSYSCSSIRKKSPQDLANAEKKAQAAIKPKKGLTEEDVVFDTIHHLWKNDFFVGSTCVTINRKNYAKWLAFFKKKTVRANSLEEAYALEAIMTGVIFDLSREGDNAEIKDEYKNFLFSVYKDFELNDGWGRFWRSSLSVRAEGGPLEYGAWLGDLRSLDVAEKAIDQYLAGDYDDDDKYQQAVFAVMSFKTRSPDVIGRINALIAKARGSSRTPDYLVRKIKEDEERKRRAAQDSEDDEKTGDSRGSRRAD